ncbi:MAG: hypothetical protein RSD79_06635 [Cetobacterium sp.]
MFKGYILDVIADTFEELLKPVEKPKKEIEKEELKFSTDIQDVQDFCFKEGIKGNCNESCSRYKTMKCELEV